MFELQGGTEYRKVLSPIHGATFSSTGPQSCSPVLTVSSSIDLISSIVLGLCEEKTEKSEKWLFCTAGQVKAKLYSLDQRKNKMLLLTTSSKYGVDVIGRHHESLASVALLTGDYHLSSSTE